VTFIVAHRGVHDEAPENTLEAFRAARTMGVDGVELDVHRTSDGQLVVHHDFDVAGSVIAAHPASALPAHVATLEECLDVLGPLFVNVEIKTPDDDSAERDVLAVTRDVLAVLRGRSTAGAASISSFDLGVCRLARQLDDAVGVEWLNWRVPLREALDEAHRRGFSGVNPHYLLVHADEARRAAELQLTLNVWTVNDDEDLRAQLGLPLTSIITDRPQRALALRDERARDATL